MDALRAKNSSNTSIINGVNDNRVDSTSGPVTASSAIASIYAEEQQNNYRQSANQNTNSNNDTNDFNSDHDNTPVNNTAITDDLLASCAQTLTQSHDKAIVDTVMRDVVQRDLGVTFDDIASLHTAKRLLNEAVVLPLIMPEFFTGIREPWKVWDK